MNDIQEVTALENVVRKLQEEVGDLLAEINVLKEKDTQNDLCDKERYELLVAVIARIQGIERALARDFLI